MKRPLLALALLGAALWAEDPRLVIESGGHLSQIKFVAFTRDGKYLVSAGDDKVVRVWDVDTGQMVRALRGQIGEGNEGKLFAAALSPDNRYLAVAGWLAGDGKSRDSIRIHDFRTGAVVALLKGHVNLVNSLAFSPDNRHLASGSADHSVRIWDIAAKTSVELRPWHRGDIYGLAFSEDGKRLVSGSEDHSLRLWDASNGRLIQEMPGHQNSVMTALFSPDGKYIVSGSLDKTIRLWDARTGQFIRQLAENETQVRALSFSPDGHRLLAGTDRFPYMCAVYEFPSGKLLTRFAGHTNVVLATAISLDGETAATAGGDRNEIYLWSLSTGQVKRKLVGAGQPVWSVAFSKDGQSIAFGNEFDHQRPALQIPLPKTILLRTASETPVSLGRAVRSETDFIRASDHNGDLQLRPKAGENYPEEALEILKDGKTLHEIDRDSTSGYRRRCYSLTPDGRYVASGGNGGVLTLFSTESGKPVADLVGHTSVVWAVAVSPDGHTLVSGSDDQTIRLWDIPSGRNLLSIFVGEDQEWVAWTPEGYYTSSVNGDKYIGWHVNRGVAQLADFYSAAQFQKQFYRPDVISEYLKTRDIQLAVRNANTARAPNSPAPAALGAQDVIAMLPPMISISSPDRDGITVQEATLSVRAEALSNTLPITDVRVLLNGVEVSGGAGGTAKGDPRHRRVEVEVQLRKGLNLLSIFASNEKAMSESETRRIYYKSASGAGVDSKPALIVLAIGISKYDKPAFKLNFAAADATDVQNAFEQQKSVAKNLFREVKTRLITDEQASRTNILSGLKWLSQEGTQGDLRVLFLSGHGGLEGDSYYFYSRQHDPEGDPEDNDISWTILMKRLTDAKSKVALFVDTCHAAAVTGPQKRGEKTISQIIKDMKNDYYGVVTFAAATGEESSVERPEWGHGAFTEALLEGLQGKAARNEDGVVETAELGAWIARRVRELTNGDQHAIFSPSPGLPSFALCQVDAR
jgi:WD40 repeat protein